MKRNAILNILLIFFSISQVFASYTADDLVDIMKTNSPSVKSSELSVSNSRLEKQKALGDFLPKIEYGATGAYIANPLGPINISADSIIAALDLPSGAIGNLKPGAYVPVYGGMENTHYSFSLSLTQPLITWGKLTRQYQIYEALENVEMNKHSLKLKKDEAEIRARVSSLALLKELTSILDEANKDAKELSGLVEKTTDDSMSTKEDLFSSLSASLKIQNAFVSANSERVSQLESLGLLTGIYDLKEDEIVLEIPALDEFKSFLSSQSELSMVASAISSDKEAIKMLDTSIDIAEKKRYVSYASMLYAPDVALMANLSYGGSRFPFIESGWSSKDDWNAIIAIRLQGTLFDGTKQWANLSESKNEVEKANLEKENAVQTLINTVKSLHRELEVSISAIEYKEAVKNEKEEAFRIASSKYETRQISRIDYLRSSLEAKGAKADVYTEYIKAITIYNTLKFLI